MTAAVTRAADPKKPNILILWGDDIGYWNLSAYNQGMMGYKTANIDRIAKEGALFTDWYGQQSCTAGRSCFITGQSGFRAESDRRLAKVEHEQTESTKRQFSVPNLPKNRLEKGNRK
jgi:arylsulfatase A-like enzyme